MAIRKIRKEKGISQEALAYGCEISRNHMYKIENGKSSPTVKMLELVASELKIKVSDIVIEAEKI